MRERSVPAHRSGRELAPGGRFPKEMPSGPRLPELQGALPDHGSPPPDVDRVSPVPGIVTPGDGKRPLPVPGNDNQLPFDDHGAGSVHEDIFVLRKRERNEKNQGENYDPGEQTSQSS